MTKEMEHLLSIKDTILNKGESLKKEGNYDELVRLTNEELKPINDKIDALQKYEEAEKNSVANEVTLVAGVKDEKSPDGFKVLAKMMKGRVLDEGEKQLVTGTNATQNENYLLPEDVRLGIIELKRQYDSARDIVGYTETTALNGRFNLEKGGITGLVAFDDGDVIDGKDAPSFDKLEFAIAFYGKLIPISNILQGAEKAGLMTYLDKWFVKNAVFTENKAIFDALKLNKDSSIKDLTDWKKLRSSINKDIDPMLIANSIIVTNQSGFNALDEAVDGNGRPILAPNPKDPAEKLFNGLPVRVFSDKQLPNIDTTHAPIFYGDTRTGVQMIMYKNMEFAMSTEFLFNKNQTCLRVIEGFVVKQFDKDAYMYGKLSLTAAAAAASK